MSMRESTESSKMLAGRTASKGRRRCTHRSNKLWLQAARRWLQRQEELDRQELRNQSK